jgi:hypothetical protein
MSLLKIQNTTAPSKVIYTSEELHNLIQLATNDIHTYNNNYMPFSSMDYLEKAKYFFEMIALFPPSNDNTFYALPSNCMFGGITVTYNTLSGPISGVLNQFIPGIGTTTLPRLEGDAAYYPDLHIPHSDYLKFLANPDKDGGLMTTRSHVLTAEEGKWLHGSVIGKTVYIITVLCKGFVDKNDIQKKPLNVIKDSLNCGYTVSIELDGTHHIGYFTKEPLVQQALDVAMVIEVNLCNKILTLIRGKNQDGEGRIVITAGEHLTPHDIKRKDNVRRAITEEMGDVPTKSFLISGGTFENIGDPRYTIYSTHVMNHGIMTFGVERATTTDLEIVFTTIEAATMMGEHTDKKEIAGKKWEDMSLLPSLSFWMNCHRKFISVIEEKIAEINCLSNEDRDKMAWL